MSTRCSRPDSATDSVLCRAIVNSSNGSARTMPAARRGIGSASTASTRRWRFSAAPSPRHALSSVNGCLPSALRPESARDLDALLGEDADWSNQAAMYDPAASIGDSDRARALRIVADDLASASAPRGTRPALRRPDRLRQRRRARAHRRRPAALSRGHGQPGTRSHSDPAQPARGDDGREPARDRRRGAGPRTDLVFAHNEHLRRAHRARRGGLGECRRARRAGPRRALRCSWRPTPTRTASRTRCRACWPRRPPAAPCSRLRPCAPRYPRRSTHGRTDRARAHPAAARRDLDGTDAVIFVSRHRRATAPVLVTSVED